MPEKEPIEPGAFLDLFNYFNGNGNFHLRLFQAMGQYDPERKLQRFTKPHALACLFISIMMLRSGHDLESIKAEFQEFLEGKTLAQIGQTCKKVRYNEIGGNDFEMIASMAGFTRSGLLSGNDYDVTYGSNNSFGPYVIFENYRQYFPDKVDLITACKVFEIGSGIERLGPNNLPAIELLGCIANSLAEGGFLLVEEKMTGIDNKLLESLGFTILLKDKTMDSISYSRGGSVFQFSPVNVGDTLKTVGILVNNKKKMVWSDVKREFVLENC